MPKAYVNGTQLVWSMMGYATACEMEWVSYLGKHMRTCILPALYLAFTEVVINSEHQED